MQSLTAAEIAILKSRFQAGADGHSQQVVLTARVPDPNAGAILRSPEMPWVVAMPNGQAGMIFRADRELSGAPDRAVWFLGYESEHSLRQPIEIFPYDSIAYGLVVWYGALVAVCRDPSSGDLVYRTSLDFGVTWTTEAPLGTLSYVDSEAIGTSNDEPTLQVVTNKAGTALYVFTKNTADLDLMYDVTTEPDLSIDAWAGTANSGMTIPSIGRNQGGAGPENQSWQRGFVVCETSTPDLWAIACESDDADPLANHMVATGTLGGAWTNVLNVGYGGDGSGNQGANGGVFLDRQGFLNFYVMDDGGTDAVRYLSPDDGGIWVGPDQMIQPGIAYGEGIGGGSGASIPAYSGLVYIWGGIAGTASPAIGVHNRASVTNFIRIYGVGKSGSILAYHDVTTDVSDRVRAISTQKDATSESAGWSVELTNTDGAINKNNTAAALYDWSVPNVRVQIYQWHGDVANKVLTFTGIVSDVQQDYEAQTATLVGIDRAKKLLRHAVAPTAPQRLGEEGAIRDMENYVYINKTTTEVLDDFLRKSGVPTTEAEWWPSTYVFKELIVSNGNLMAAAKDVATAAGLRIWNDEGGIWRTWPLALLNSESSVWTYRSREDIVRMGHGLDDDDTWTRVRVEGRANLGAKYLSEILVWPGLGSPADVAYDTITGHLWYLDFDSNLYRLNPADNMAIEEGPYALGLGHPDGIAVDPLDGHLWISDGFDATLGNNANREYKKISRADQSVLLGPFTNPDGDHCGIWAWDDTGTVRLKMTTYTTEDIVTMSIGGVEVSRVSSPVELPTAIASDTGGGLFLTGWEAVDFYQVDFAGSIINAIKQPSKNASGITSVEDSAAFDFGDVYIVWQEANVIAKFAVLGTPSGIPVATLAEAVDIELEARLSGERRTLTIRNEGIGDIAMAQATANATLRAVAQYRSRLMVGAVGNPGLQLNDRVTVSSPGDSLAGDWVVRSIRADQIADEGTYLMALVLEPIPTPVVIMGYVLYRYLTVFGDIKKIATLYDDGRIEIEDFNTEDDNNAQLAFERNTSPHIFTMSDGAVVGFMKGIPGDDSSNAGYQIRQGGAWGASVAYSEHGFNEQDQRFIRVGDVIFALTNIFDPMRLQRLEYAGGALTVTADEVISGDFTFGHYGLYYDAANGLLHVWYTDVDGIDTLEAFDPVTLASVYSTQTNTAVLNQNFVGDGSDLAGAGGAEFFLCTTVTNGAAALAVRRVVAGPGSYTTTPTDETGEPALTQRANHLQALWIAGALNIVLTEDRSVGGTLDVVVRSAANTYGLTAIQGSGNHTDVTFGSIGFAPKGVTGLLVAWGTHPTNVTSRIVGRLRQGAAWGDIFTIAEDGLVPTGGSGRSS